ncbi:uncharacterized protein LOC143029207 [Oratosquilla oratoria]|uniref:uncharacterized protein LOC143029207 n=1 Tax=Oratosquilla oratoria TaxID=337810 RepID=UPI003F776F4D
MRSIRRILDITWQDKVTNAKVLSRTGLPRMHTLLRQLRLSWLGHVHRKEDGRIPKDILNEELTSGRRTTGRPQLRFKDICKRDIGALEINVNSLKYLVADRTIWRSILNQHLNTGEENLMKAVAAKRARRKGRNNSNRPETFHRCEPLCKTTAPHWSL